MTFGQLHMFHVQMVMEYLSCHFLYNIYHCIYNSDKYKIFLLSNFLRVLNVLCFLLGNSLASEFYMPTFRNTLFHLYRQVGAEISTPTCL